MGDRYIHMITGGQRCGKSYYGEQLALSMGKRATYLATSRGCDAAHEERIAAHRARRSSRWVTIEEPLYVAQVRATTTVVLLDCVTLWLANVWEHCGYDMARSMTFALAEWEGLMMQATKLIVIGNELGMGVIPMEQHTRDFVDLHGDMNQHIARCSTHVEVVISGLPLRIK